MKCITKNTLNTKSHTHTHTHIYIYIAIVMIQIERRDKASNHTVILREFIRCVTSTKSPVCNFLFFTSAFTLLAASSNLFLHVSLLSMATSVQKTISLTSCSNLQELTDLNIALRLFIASSLSSEMRHTKLRRKKPATWLYNVIHNFGNLFMQIHSSSTEQRHLNRS